MPFGSDPFRDLIRPKLIQQLKSFCHQCLSAVIPFGTDRIGLSAHQVLNLGHQCLSAVIPFGTRRILH